MALGREWVQETVQHLKMKKFLSILISVIVFSACVWLVIDLIETGSRVSMPFDGVSLLLSVFQTLAIAFLSIISLIVIRYSLFFAIGNAANIIIFLIN